MLLTEEIDSEDSEDEDFEPNYQNEEDESLFQTEFEQILPNEISKLIEETNGVDFYEPSTESRKIPKIEEIEEEVYKDFLKAFDQKDELKEEEEDDPDFVLSEEEKPNKEVEEYRFDQAVKVSSKELSSLFFQPKIITSSSSSSFASSSAAVHVLPIPSTRRGKKPKPILIQPFQPIKPMTTSSEEQCQINLTEEIQNKIESQIKTHFQLLLQMYAVMMKDYLLETKSKDLLDEQQKLIIELSEKRKYAMFWKSLVLSRNALNDDDSKRITRSQTRFPQKLELMANIHSVYDFQGFELLDSFLKSIQNTSTAVVSSPNFLKIVLTPFLDKGYFDPNIMEVDWNKKLKTNTFTSAEDRLLAMGLEKFGTQEWENIQKYYLPTKTLKQLVNRYKNMSSVRGGSENPIKLFSKSKKQKDVHSFISPDWDLKIGNPFLPAAGETTKKRKNWVENSDQWKPILNPEIQPKEPLPLSTNNRLPASRVAKIAPVNFQSALPKVNPNVKNIVNVSAGGVVNNNSGIVSNNGMFGGSDSLGGFLNEFSNNSLDWGTLIPNLKPNNIQTNPIIQFDVEDIDSASDDDESFLNKFDDLDTEKYSLMDSMQKSLDANQKQDKIEFEIEDIDSDEEIERKKPWNESEDRLILEYWSNGRNTLKDWKELVDSKKIIRNLDEIQERYQMLKRICYENQNSS
jgi:hypothetical protein